MHWLAHLLDERHEHTWKGSFKLVSLSWCLKFTNLHEEQRERSRSLLIRWTIKQLWQHRTLLKRLELRPGSCKASKERAIDRPFFVSISGVAFCAIPRDGKQLREDSGKLLEKPSGPLASSFFVVSTWLVSVPNTNFGLCKHVKVNINSLWEHPTAAEETAKKHYRNIYILNILWIITRLRCPLLPSPLPLFPSLLSNVKCARLWHMLQTLDVARLFLWRMASNLSEISRYETVF